MPIINIYSLPSKSPQKISSAIQTLADIVAEEMQLPPQTVRCIWQEVPSSFYTLGSSTSANGSECRGPIISLTLFEGRGADFIQKLMSVIAGVLAHSLEIDPKTILIVCSSHKFYEAFDQGQCFTIDLFRNS